jgi:hypothetical protein
MKQGEEDLTREELAKTCGVSKSTIRRWEKQGKVKPRINERGVHLFRLDDVRELVGDKPIKRLAQARTYVPSAANVDGDRAAEVFEVLDRRIHPVEIVRKLHIHPDVLDGFLSRWIRWRRAHVLTPDEVRLMTKAIGVRLVGPGIDFIAQVQKALKYFRRPCVSCNRGRPAYCSSCRREKEERLEEKLLRELGNGASHGERPPDRAVPDIGEEPSLEDPDGEVRLRRAVRRGRGAVGGDRASRPWTPNTRGRYLRRGARGADFVGGSSSGGRRRPSR